MLKTSHKYTNCCQLLVLMLCLSSSSVFGQSEKEKKAIFAQAEAYYLYEDYELANQLYILLDDETNMNIKFKIGVCYLNISGEKANAIPFLEEAVKTASYEAKENRYSEKRAPLDAYFYLAKAYMINNELEKGLAVLKQFDELSRGGDAKGSMENIDFINQQIQACNNAIRFVENPIEISKKMLGGGFADGSLNENPVVSFDGNSIAYTEHRGIANVIMYSRKERGEWQLPMDITTIINAGDDCSTCSFNADGTELYLYKNDIYDGNIYVAKLVNNSWSPIEKLNKNINSKYYESHASISADGNTLYFTSNKEGGFGGLDIYMSKKEASGDWGPAENVGNVINTPYNEDTPFITANDSTLFFSSEGHLSMGGYDLFSSQRAGSTWKTPSNIGSPINTTDDDKFFQPFNNGKNGYLSMTTDYKKKDIFYITLGPSLSNDIFAISGYFALSDTVVPFAEYTYSVDLIKKPSNDTIDIGYPNKITGQYGFTVTAGSYQLIFTGYGYQTVVIDTTITRDSPSSIIVINATLDRDYAVELMPSTPIVYEKLSFENLEVVEVDTASLVTDVVVSDVDDTSVEESDILYYTVQLMALYNPVSITHFKYVNDIVVLYNETDKFYRYTTGQFDTKEEAENRRSDLLTKGYPDQIFVKKVSQ